MSKHQLLDSQAGFYYGTKIGDDKSSYNIAEYVEINHTRYRKNETCYSSCHQPNPYAARSV